MEEKVRMRPNTARPTEEPLFDLSSSNPIDIFSFLTNIPPAHFPHLAKLELKTDIEEIPFHKFGGLCPNLRELKLSNSNLESTRSLGTEWKNLEILWLVQTNLQNIDGISVFPKLKELYCAFNSISSLSSLFFNETLQVLDVEGNQIEDFSEIESLQYCSSLFSLTLEGNPVSKIKEFREKVFKSVASLKILDDVERETEIKVENYEEVEIVMNSVRESSRIMKKGLKDCRNRTEKNIFCEEGSELTEEVFSGNPIKAMRFRRKKLFEGNNFMELVKEFRVGQDGSVEVGKGFRVRGKKEEMYDTK